jgi:hypothetical protein
MAVTNFSPLLGLALPTTGDLSGTWGTTVNNSITSLIDSAVAGTTTLSADADVTLSTTNGAANQARNAVILWTASNGATTRTVTAPAQSKAYVVINAGTGSVIIKGSGTVSPYNGVTVPSGTKALIAWNGSDFVKVVSNPVVLTTDVSGTLPIANGGTGTTSTTFANLTTNVTGTLPVANGGTGTTTPALVAGTNVTISGTWPNQTINSSVSGGTVTAVTASSPLASSGGTTPNLSLTGTVPVANGGTGTTTPALVAGTNVTISGTWPNQTINATGSGGGTVTSVGMTVPSFLSVAGSPVTSSGTLAVTLSGTALPIANGGTGTTSPSIVAGSNISVTGSWPNQTIATTGSGAVLTVNTYTSSTTWTVPTGVTSILCEVIGGGGGCGVSATIGGGGGGFAYGSIAVSAGQVLTITVGTGGTGNQPYPNTGNAGGTSEIVRSGSSLISAAGGGGGGQSAGNGTGGSATGGTIYNIIGGNGTNFGSMTTGVPGASGRGFPTSYGVSNGPGAGGYGQGNTLGTNGNNGQITIQYVA